MSATALLDAPATGAATWPSAHLLGHLPRAQQDVLGLFLEARREHGDAVWMRMAFLNTLHLNRVEHLQHVFLRHEDRYAKSSRGYQILRTMLGQGLLTAEGEHWKRQRRIAQPAFRKGIVDGFARTMVRRAAELATEWDSALDREIDVAEDMSRLTLRIACDTLFSHDIAPVEAVVSEGLDAIIDAFDRMVTSALPMPWKWPTPANLEGRRALARLDAVVNEIIAERRASSEPREDLLQMLMDARYEDTGEGMDDAQLRDEVLTMLLAGHETTTNTLSFALYLLSQRPLVADRLAEHIDGVLGDRDPEGADFRALDQVGYVINEALRLYPPAWTNARRAVVDDEIEGIAVPAGTMVFISPWVMHRHPDYWRDPDVFDPDRWRPERAGSRPRLAFHPFSVGQRKCIGEHFALLEARLVLAVLARRFQLHLRPGHQLELDASVTLRVGNGLPMRITRR